jgi:hypothetical protein
MSFRCYQDIKTQTRAWEAALEAAGSRAEDFRTLFADEPASCSSPPAARRTTWGWPTPPSGGSGWCCNRGTSY